MNPAEIPRLVHRCFFARAEEYPTRSALSFRQGHNWESWTYEKLRDRARRIGRMLHQQGFQAGDAIGITAVRHPDSLAAMIAILGIGGLYVPLDLHYPEAHLRNLCRDARLKVVLTAVSLEKIRGIIVPVQVLSDLEVQAPETPEFLCNEAGLSEDTPAYIMFTSGSTGEPKGVIVPHRAIVRLVDRPNFMRLDASRSMVWLAPLGFDASTLEIWAPLLNGGQCVIFPEESLPTAANLKEVIRTNRVNALWLTASLFNNIVDQDVSTLAGLDEILTGGEALSVPHVCKAIAALKGTQLINGYGPTENTTFTACYRVPADFTMVEPRVPIGFPISGTDVVVVDDQFQPVQSGFEGELIALGDGLALGYLNKPDLTRERFINISLPNGEWKRGYRTGDRVVRNTEGRLDFLGRFDDQVKIDGHRIEPGEIERVLSGFEGIKECRVLTVVGPLGNKRLVAYVMAEKSGHQDNLRERLAEILPGFMVPHFFFYIDKMPINANGKLDKSALPDPFGKCGPVPPDGADPEWIAVSQAWFHVLGRGLPSDDFNFFDAGGTSLDALKLLQWIEGNLGRRLDPTFVFEHTTIRRQAEALRKLEGDKPRETGRGQLRRAALNNQTPVKRKKGNSG